MEKIYTIYKNKNNEVTAIYMYSLWKAEGHYRKAFLSRITTSQGEIYSWSSLTSIRGLRDMDETEHGLINAYELLFIMAKTPPELIKVPNFSKETLLKYLVETLI